MSVYTCKKCGEELVLDDVSEWPELCCPECSEPIPQEELLRRESGDGELLRRAEAAVKKADR